MLQNELLMRHQRLGGMSSSPIIHHNLHQYPDSSGYPPDSASSQFGRSRRRSGGLDRTRVQRIANAYVNGDELDTTDASVANEIVIIDQRPPKVGDAAAPPAAASGSGEMQSLLQTFKQSIKSEFKKRTKQLKKVSCIY